MKNVYYGVNKNDKEAFKSYKIELTEIRYSKTDSGKSWRTKADSEEVRVITFNEYFNFLSSVDFFKGLGGSERVEKGYCIAGYIPTKLTSISPTKDAKIVRKFKITRA